MHHHISMKVRRHQAGHDWYAIDSAPRQGPGLGALAAPSALTITAS
jgi:hypothetical protein